MTISRAKAFWVWGTVSLLAFGLGISMGQATRRPGETRDVVRETAVFIPVERRVEVCPTTSARYDATHGSSDPTLTRDGDSDDEAIGYPTTGAWRPSGNSGRAIKDSLQIEIMRERLYRLRDRLRNPEPKKESKGKKK